VLAKLIKGARFSVVKDERHSITWPNVVVRKQDSSLRALFLLEELFDARDIAGNVDADGVVGDFGDADAPAVLEPAELFELLYFFEFALRECGVFEKGIALENVEAQMLPIFHVEFLLRVSNPGDGSAGKVQGVAVKIEDGFDDVWIHNVPGVSDGSDHGGDLRRGFFEKSGDGSVDGDRIDERLVPLDIDENVPWFVSGHLGDALGSRAMVGAGHTGFAAERLNGIKDALVVGGNENAMNSLGAFGAPVDVLDHGFAGKRDERLAGEARGGVACRNHDDDVRVGHGRRRSEEDAGGMLTYAGAPGLETGVGNW
jgi:hypothetical protein